MLFPTVHLPRLYAEAPPDPRAGDLYLALLSGILCDARENCLLLMDEANTLGNEILTTVNRWPPAYRDRAKAQLKKLKKDNRLVPVPDAGPLDRGCARPGCQRGLQIASRQRPSLVLGSGECSGCAYVNREGVSITDVGGYVVSEFARLRRSGSLLLAEGEWAKADFEREVWHPLFRYAKHVKIFDRNVGRHLLRWMPAEGRAAVNPRVREDYRRTQEWIFELFTRVTAGRPARVFEVTCGVNSSDTAAVGEAAGVLRHFARELSAKCGFELTMRVKLESRTAHLRHDRFLITDQVALMIGRGFDLLTEEDLIRDTVVTYVSNPGEIEREAPDLPDAAS